MRARGTRVEHRFGKVAVRIEERDALAVRQILFDKVEEEGALAGAGLSDDVKVSAALLRIEHDKLARHAGADANLLARCSHSRRRAGVPCASQFGK